MKKLFSFKYMYNSFSYYPFYFTYFSVREFSRGYTASKGRKLEQVWKMLTHVAKGNSPQYYM